MDIIFETPRLILRRFTKKDASLLLELNSDLEVLKYLHEPVLHAPEQALKILGRYPASIQDKPGTLGYTCKGNYGVYWLVRPKIQS